MILHLNTYISTTVTLRKKSVYLKKKVCIKQR
ncbi:hypothetical protein MXB_5705 [Myxobolus squamalis]|nr:hypothetical protein MXB_5705 [Myxobolus squamalis]